MFNYFAKLKSIFLLVLTLIGLNFSCQEIKEKRKVQTEVSEIFVLQNPYHYTVDIEGLGKTNLHFDFNEELGAEGTMITKDELHKFRIEYVMPIGGYLSLKIIKKGFKTNDLTYYDYIINFEHKNLGKEKIKASFYDKNTEIRTSILLHHSPSLVVD